MYLYCLVDRRCPIKCRNCGKECVDVGFGHCLTCAKKSQVETAEEFEVRLNGDKISTISDKEDNG